MRKFAVYVNGKEYEIAIEELGRDAEVKEAASSPAPPKVSAQLPNPIPKAAPKAAPSVILEGEHKINSPMPGTILSINVKLGDIVEKGQVLCMLEAMKMENEILSDSSGKVSLIEVKQGDSVDSGQTLIILE